MRFYIFFYFCVVWFGVTGCKPTKIVGLMQVRNEQAVIAQALRTLAMYTDAIVVLDDASDDATVAIVTDVADQYRVEKIICNTHSAWEHGTETDNRQKLLDSGRAIGGTHFIIIDADEMLSALCYTNNFLRTLIARLNPGDRLQLNIVHYWQSIERYRTYFDEKMKYFIFCDDGVCSYYKDLLHVPRVPINLQGGANLELNDAQYVLLHFGYYNWLNVLMRQAWYRCLERVRNPEKSCATINWWYPAHKEKDFATQVAPADWLAGYTFFDRSVFDQPDTWRVKQINHWFAIHGKEFFKELEIWHINWDAQ